MTVESGLEPNVLQAVPFLRVSHMAASLHFYIDGLGFTITKRWIDEGQLRWCWIELGRAALMLQEFPTEGHDAWKPTGKLGEGISITFICHDALAIYRAARARDLAASRPFVGNGMWVTALSDPDGYQLEFESATDAPEESGLAEDEDRLG